MPGLPSTYISPETIKEAMNESSGFLTPPEGASISGVPGEKGYRASWSEVLDIVKIETAPSKQPGSEWVITKVQCTVAPEYPGANPGRAARIQFNLFPSAQGNRKHEYFGLHSKALARMTNLLIAAGMLNEGDGFNPVDYYDNPSSPLLGQRVYATVTRFVKKDGTEEQDISNFTQFASI